MKKLLLILFAIAMLGCSKEENEGYSQIYQLTYADECERRLLEPWKDYGESEMWTDFDDAHWALVSQETRDRLVDEMHGCHMIGFKDIDGNELDGYFISIKEY